MRKTNNVEPNYKLAVDINGLQILLSVGKMTAYEIGEKAGASFKIGKRRLFNVKKIEEYLDSITED